MKNYYVGKPQAIYFKACTTSLPDYSNDSEVIDHIDRVFIQPLDEEALRRVSKACKQTVIAVAMSPWASLDMAFSLWRSIKMIEDVAQVYGMRPSLYNRYKLVKSVIHQLVFVGVTESVMDSVSDVVSGGLSDSALTPLMSVGSARIGQGVGAGI
jgi:putative membrane protein